MFQNLRRTVGFHERTTGFFPVLWLLIFFQVGSAGECNQNFVLWVSSGGGQGISWNGNHQWYPDISSLQPAKNQCAAWKNRPALVTTEELLELSGYLERWILTLEGPQTTSELLLRFRCKNLTQPIQPSPHPFLTPCLPKREATPFHSMRLHCPFHEENTDLIWKDLDGRPLHIWKVPSSPLGEGPANSREKNLGQCFRCHNICGFNQCCEAIFGL